MKNVFGYLFLTIGWGIIIVPLVVLLSLAYALNAFVWLVDFIFRKRDPVTMRNFEGLNRFVMTETRADKLLAYIRNRKAKKAA